MYSKDRLGKANRAYRYHNVKKCDELHCMAIIIFHALAIEETLSVYETKEMVKIDQHGTEIRLWKPITKIKVH